MMFRFTLYQWSRECPGDGWVLIVEWDKGNWVNRLWGRGIWMQESVHEDIGKGYGERKLRSFSRDPNQVTGKLMNTSPKENNGDPIIRDGLGIV